MHTVVCKPTAKHRTRDVSVMAWVMYPRRASWRQTHVALAASACDPWPNHRKVRNASPPRMPTMPPMTMLTPSSPRDSRMGMRGSRGRCGREAVWDASSSRDVFSYAVVGVVAVRVTSVSVLAMESNME